MTCIPQLVRNTPSLRSLPRSNPPNRSAPLDHSGERQRSRKQNAIQEGGDSRRVRPFQLIYDFMAVSPVFSSYSMKLYSAMNSGEMRW
jgi:hypothetical protein